MKSKLSTFLNSTRPIVEKLVNELNVNYSYVSILGTDTIGNQYSMSRRNSSVNDSQWAERGFVLRVFNGVNYSEYSFNTIKDPEFVKTRINEIAKNDILAFQEAGIHLDSYPLIEEKEDFLEYHSEFEIDPFTISSEEKLSRMSEVMNKGLQKSEFLVDFRVNFEEVMISKIFISSKKNLSQSILYSTLSVVAIGRKDGKIKYDFKSDSGLKGYEIFNHIDRHVDKVTDSVIGLFDSENVVPGTYDIICDPSVSGLIAHEAFGHGVEMDMFVKNRAKGAEYIGKKIASDKVNMRDGALSANHVGTYLFDDEGTLGSDTLIIENSILKAGISDILSALKLGTKPTGNGKRESFERKAYARMTNTFFEGGTDTLEDMIASIQKGYLLEGYFSGMEDPKNWGIQCVIAKGREIIDGKFSGKIVSPVLLTGYVPDLLQSISMVGSGIELSGSGACGKGYKEWVKTSTGGTYMKAVGRLG
ncbi:MAG: TldD/PmbA family protein [Bacilli bacterium]|nr:TldD/PmbA family protein [Bacilli bacterium]